MEDVIEIIMLMLMVFEARKLLEKNEKRRGFWERSLFQSQDTNDFFTENFNKLIYNDPEQFRIAVRMNRKVFQQLLNLVKKDLSKNSNRTPIPPDCRLFLTLMYLAHGGNNPMFGMAFKIEETNVRRIVKETCEVLWTKLRAEYLSVPNRTKWRNISHDCNSKWNLPNCVGAIDGKHIVLTCPVDSGSQYSIVLIGVCDANYTFTAVDIGAYSQSDTCVFPHTDFGQRLRDGRLDLPANEPLPNTNMKFPYFFVANAGFPLKPFLMRPYPGNNLPWDRAIFNIRLSKPQRIIENTFGILAARWKILLSPLRMSPSTAEAVVKSTVVLHNFVKMNNPSYCPPDYMDSFRGDTVIDGLWRREVPAPLQRNGRLSSNNASREAFELRNHLKDYVVQNPIQ